MQNFEYEININIFKYVDYPLNLALTSQSWSVIAKDPYAKSEWLIVHYGKLHALFHAVRLGPTFIDMPLCQTLIARNVVILRYFVQRLLMHFGKYDQKLIELKLEHNVRVRAFQQINLPMSVFIYLLNEGYKQLSNPNAVGPMNYYPAGVLRKKDIDPTRAKANDRTIHPFEEFPFKDGKNDKFFDFLRQESLARPVTVFSVRILRTRPLRSINQRRRQNRERNQRMRQRRQRLANRYRRSQLNAAINNEDTLNRIANLPRQVTSDPLINQFFNGFI